MAYLTIESGELALDILGLILCCLTLFFLVGQRWMANRSIAGQKIKMNNSKPGRPTSKKSCEEFETLFHAARKERLVLYDLTGHKEPVESKTDSLAIGALAESVTDRKSGGKDLTQDFTASGPYSQAEHLADMGFGLKEISKRTGIPKAEIQLIIKLRGRDNKQGRQDGSRMA